MYFFIAAITALDVYSFVTWILAFNQGRAQAERVAIFEKYLLQMDANTFTYVLIILNAFSLVYILRQKRKNAFLVSMGVVQLFYVLFQIWGLL